MSAPTEVKQVSKLSDLRQALAAFEQIPGYEEDPEYYKDWGQKSDFQLKVTRGECMI